MAKLKENSTIVKVSGEELIATEPKVLSMIQENSYVHPATHPASMITGLHACATTGVAGSVAWSNVTGKPSTFAPSSHSHSAGDLPSATTSAKGVVQLSSAVNSTSTTLAATASAVKAAYDLANSKWTYNEATIKAVKVNSAGTADTLATARTINGTSFNGSANITTANWGTARTITIGNTGKSVNGSANVSWSLSEIGAAPASHTHTASQVGLGNVQNYGIATKEQAEAGTANDVYMTPLRVANALDLIKGALFPSGGIIMWSGSINDIPVGWALCDGTNGTPDLRDRFIVGAGRKYNVGNTGGADRVTLTVAQMPSHNHGSGDLATTTDGSHSHSYIRPSGGISAESGDYDIYRGIEDADTSSDGYHDHDVTGNTGSTGGGQAHENRPPYYALCFIMKL